MELQCRSNSADKMKIMLSSLGSMTADSTVENPEDVSEYGIDQPTQQVTLNFSDGSEKTLTFGTENEIVGGTYVQVSGDDNCMDVTIFLTDMIRHVIQCGIVTEK